MDGIDLFRPDRFLRASVLLLGAVFAGCQSDPCTPCSATSARTDGPMTPPSVAAVASAPGPKEPTEQPAQFAAYMQPDVVQPAPEILPPQELIPPPVPRRLSLAELETMALTANPAVARASALVGAARGTAIQVGLPPNPSVGYIGQQLGSGGLAEQHGIQVSQDIITGGKLELNRAVAEEDVNRARQELAVLQQRVLTDVRISFYQVLLAQRQIEFSESLVKTLRQGADAVNALLKGKEASRADLLQAQLEVENAQVISRNAHNRHDAAWRTLAAVSGNPNLPQQTLDGDAFASPRVFEFEQARLAITSSSPEMAVAMTELTRARLALDRANVETIPNISVQGLVNTTDNGVGGRTDGGISLMLPIPLFNKNEGNIMRAQHEVAAAKLAVQQLELNVQNRLAPVFERYSNARNQVERYRTAILPAAQESLDLTGKAYKVGEVSFIAFLTAQRTFTQTNLNYLEAVRELRIAEMEIDGLLLSGSLGN